MSMIKSRLVRAAALGSLAFAISGVASWALAQADAPADKKPANSVMPVVEDDGTVHMPSIAVPFSSLGSKEAKDEFVRFVRTNEAMQSGKCGSVDDCLFIPGVKRLRSAHSVEIKAERIGGVQTDIVTPAGGVPKKNANRVLINLHGGGFWVGARYAGQMEAIPIASIGGYKVVTVDFRQNPHKYPAATEDVATVYQELLKKYRPENIGIYGCSSGGLLSAESVAWFQHHKLPRPGAVGIFGSGAFIPIAGDSNRAFTPLGETPHADPVTGEPLRYFPENLPGFLRFVPYFDVPNLDVNDPLISPARSPSVLAKFPPTLLLSGTRDAALSGVVYTHTQLVKAGADADLHVWEGMHHCAYAENSVDDNTPEIRDAYNVIAKFFDKHLGKQKN